MRSSILQISMRDGLGNGVRFARLMAGSYLADTLGQLGGLFSANVVMMRDDDLAKLERYPVRRWKIGLMKDFGIHSPSKVRHGILRKLNINNVN
ncbi:hypothetical protein [Pontivivens ytuae]|uniref:Uncharacterized protein n=1 Tax=Pontivivens ytuae TaxID=2789856 RepID=A0A7S9LSU5_9RHOB|nr:hypothetical protein [Pontivivens ytuae]QPH54669.1 hypothetical protein I0K15_02480 [Pontivivens ytuae]